MDTPQVSWGYSESKFLVRCVDLLVCSAYFNMSATEDNKNLLMTSLTKGNDVLSFSALCMLGTDVKPAYQLTLFIFVAPFELGT